MKKVFALLVVALILCSSCQRSQFSTTTRHFKNGKAVYTNHYPLERNTFSKGGSGGRNTNSKAAISGDEINFLANPPEFLASISMNSMSYGKNNNRTYLSPDTISQIKTDTNLTFDPSHAQIIKFKNGDVDTVRIVSHSEEGLYYRSVSEPKKARFAAIGQVDTILTDTTYSFKPKETEPPVKVNSLEKKGLIHSIIGFIPIAGIPFAIIGIIIGARSLHRIRKNLQDIEGKRMAISTIIIGIAALVFNIIISIIILTTIVASMSSTFTGCDSGIHF